MSDDLQRQFLEFVNDFEACDSDGPDAVFAALNHDLTELSYDACDSLHLKHGAPFADGVAILQRAYESEVARIQNYLRRRRSEIDEELNPATRHPMLQRLERYQRGVASLLDGMRQVVEQVRQRWDRAKHPSLAMSGA